MSNLTSELIWSNMTVTDGDAARAAPESESLSKSKQGIEMSDVFTNLVYGQYLALNGLSLFLLGKVHDP